MSTGENEQGLRKILDMTRLMSVILLCIHFYYTCYHVFNSLQITSVITDRLLTNLYHAGLFSSFNKVKLFSLLFLTVSLIGIKGKPAENINIKKALLYVGLGLVVFFSSQFLLYLNHSKQTLAGLYITTTLGAYLLILTGTALFARMIRMKMTGAIFNHRNETFPQEERLLTNEFSINLPARYNLKGKTRRSWINIINPFRGLLVLGSPGSGKSYFIIHHIIRQHISKGFCVFVYDFKYDDLTRLAYNQYLKYKHVYPVEPKFYVINFDDLCRSHRCNPLDVKTINDITDAAESSRTIMLGLNAEWIRKGGDFFVESPINFVTALIWYLCKIEKGKYCTLAHVIELAQIPYDKLFSVLRCETQIEALVNPFVSAYLNDAKEQLEGQIASAKISLSKLSSPQLYYVLSGNDFTLDINNPIEPKIVCMGNNPQKTQTYGAVISLYTTAITRLMNKKGCMKSSLIFDEFPTIYFNGIDNLIATARSNKVATTLAVQDGSQLRLHYGKEQAEVIMNITGNIISGQINGDTARHLSEKFGKILQDRESISVNRNDTSITKSKQLESAVPISRISALSAGEFVGMVADNPDQKIPLKAFCAEIINDHAALKAEEDKMKPLPVVKNIDSKTVTKAFIQIKEEIKNLVDAEIERMMNTPELEHLIIRKK